MECAFRASRSCVEIADRRGFVQAECCWLLAKEVRGWSLEDEPQPSRPRATPAFMDLSVVRMAYTPENPTTADIAAWV